MTKDQLFVAKRTLNELLRIANSDNPAAVFRWIPNIMKLRDILESEEPTK